MDWNRSRPKVKSLGAGVIRRCLWPLFILNILVGAAYAEDPPGSTRAELQRRNSNLVAQGFNFTHGFELGADHNQRTQIDLLIPPSDEPHEVSFWASAIGGEASFRITSANDQLLAFWQGQSGETDMTLSLPVGRNKVEIDGQRATSVVALLGVKGPVLSTCRLDPARVSTHQANSAAGFQWPYLLFTPEGAGTQFLLAVPNNTGFSTTDPELLTASGECTIKEWDDLANRLGTPLLVPLFPRPAIKDESENLYLHSLSRASLLTDEPSLARVDLQFIAMIDDARRILASKGMRISQRVLLTGFSASGSFVSRFAMLHPERVLAVASGSPGGWPIIPEAKDKGVALPYPIGVSDLQAVAGSPLNLPALRRVSWFYYLGGQDHNDSVIYRDSFSKTDEEIIFSHFGADLQQRWAAAEAAYRHSRLKAQFKVYPGVGHQITDYMRTDVETFLASAIRTAHVPN
jgi:pimeloyl-ACP methyl ester carboxylesterase